MERKLEWKQYDKAKGFVVKYSIGYFACDMKAFLPIVTIIEVADIDSIPLECVDTSFDFESVRYHLKEVGKDRESL
jgi:hypothetical protein